MSTRWCVILTCALTGGCASAPLSPSISAGLHEAYGVHCPEEQIEVIETRQVGDETVFLVDACGSRVEVERALVLPRTTDEWTAIPEGAPLDTSRTPRRAVPQAIVEVVRRKVQLYCALEGTPSTEDAIVFYAKTPAEIAACRAHLVASLAPHGTEEDPNTGVEVHWFFLGRNLFSVRERIYRAPCEHRSRELQNVAKHPCKDTHEPSVSARNGPRAAAAHDEGPESALEREPPIKRRWFVSIQLGLGYLSNRDGDKTYDGASWDARTAVGIKFKPSFGIGFVVANHMGLSFENPEQRPSLFEIGCMAALFPMQDSSLRLDASAGMAVLYYGFGMKGVTRMGPAFGVGVGYDAGDRTTGEGWTGPSFTLRGLYGFAGDRRTAAGVLYFGTHAW